MSLLILETFLNESISWGGFISFQIIVVLAAYLYISTRRDVEMRMLQAAVADIADLGRAHENRLRLAEETLTRIITLQETMTQHVEAIDKRHERMDALMREKRV